MPGQQRSRRDQPAATEYGGQQPGQGRQESAVGPVQSLGVGELRRGLPVGLVYGETDGEICFHPDEAVTGVLASVFGQFAVSGSARATWLWLREQGLRWPLQQVAYTGRGGGIPEITWVEPTYHAVHTTLTHPAYTGAYVYGRTRKERYLNPGGALRQRSRRLPGDQWEVLIPDHHPGFTDWDTYQARIGTNIRPQTRQPGTGAVREGCALLQGLATCGTCGRKLHPGRVLGR